MAEEDFPDLMMEEEFEQMPTFLLPPHHNGVGTEEDSLSSFLFTNPKIPKKDFKKMMEKNGVNICFLAQLHQPKHEDEARRFVISYLLDSDEVNIFEQERRNSGFIGGRFLWRSRVQNPTTHAYYKAEDFYVGAVLSINNFVFELLKADDYTNRILVESLENRTSIAEAVTLLGLDKNAAGELQGQFFGASHEAVFCFPSSYLSLLLFLFLFLSCVRFTFSFIISLPIAGLLIFEMYQIILNWSNCC